MTRRSFFVKEGGKLDLATTPLIAKKGREASES